MVSSMMYHNSFPGENNVSSHDIDDIVDDMFTWAIVWATHHLTRRMRSSMGGAQFDPIIRTKN